MTRTTLYKLFYIALLIMLSGIGIYLAVWLEFSPKMLLLMGVVLLVPGRIQGWLWRDFYTGRKQMISEQYSEAIENFNSFLNQISHRPWLKNLIWLSWGMYTRDIRVMTYNNLGACKLELGELEEAKEYFQTAAKLDPDSPIPYFNLAVTAQIQGDAKAAKQLFEKSQHLGFNRDSYDKLIMLAGETLARIEGRKTT